MIVGQRTLYHDLLKPDVKPANQTKGRSVLLMDKRNTLLCYRYFYYAFHQKKTYQDALKELENEFFIAEITIIKCLSERQADLKEIFNSKPTINDLKKQFIWLVWQSI